MTDPGTGAREQAVDTPSGPGRLLLDHATGTPTAVVVLGHGAGGQLDATDLGALARALPGRGITVVRFEQPWRTAGRRMSAPPAQLDAALIAAVARVRDEVGGLPLLVGGRSQGGRVACRTADEVGAGGVVALAFPLHPPGRPEKTRLPELLGTDVPRLVCQGERDSFGSADELRAELAAEELEGDAVTVVTVPGADHSMRVRRRDRFDATAVAALLVERVSGFVGRVSSTDR